MFKRKARPEEGERLDRIGREIVRASAANEAEANDVASSPYLYTRLRARIAAERERREGAQRWIALFALMRRAAAVMSLVAVISLSLFLFVKTKTESSRGFNDAAFFDERNAGVERVVFADRGPLSNDEVLATIMSDEREVSRSTTTP
jgi:hypothetical protein